MIDGQTDDGVTSTVQNTYTDEIRIIHSSVIIACDGTNSRIRQAAGIELEEEDGRTSAPYIACSLVASNQGSLRVTRRRDSMS